MHKTTFAEEINRAQIEAMQLDSNMLCFGLGIDDPKGIFGTTLGLAENFGAERVFDMPTSENAMTGIGIGAAIAGSRILMTHQRLDFFLLAMDQLINNAAKWHYMFNGQMKVPLTIRLIIGRGWGQGPTHAQNLQAWFAHIPGLKVIVPSRASAVAHQLYQAIMDDNPVVFIEHRWLHQQTCIDTSLRKLDDSFTTCETLTEGSDITILSSSYMVPEVLKASEYLRSVGVNCDVIDTVALHDLDWQMIFNSVKKTGRLLVCETAQKMFSCSAEIVASVSENCFSVLKAPPVRLALPSIPEPTSYGLTKEFYNNADNVVNTVMGILNKPGHVFGSQDAHHDVPDVTFKGPF